METAVLSVPTVKSASLSASSGVEVPCGVAGSNGVEERLVDRALWGRDRNENLLSLELFLGCSVADDGHLGNVSIEESVHACNKRAVRLHV